MKNWEYPPCNICGTKKHLQVLYKDVTTWEHTGKFRFLKCGKCSLVFQSPRAPFKEAVQYYPSEAYWGRDVTRNKKRSDYKLEREKAYSYLYRGIFARKIRGSVLDIGSGLGLFLSKFKEKGWKVLGTDISPDVAKFSKKLFGVKVLIGDVVNIKLKNASFDVITFNGVFEHIYNPTKTLRKVRKLLKADGLLVLAIPNIESLGHSIHGSKWHQLQPGRHLYHFSPRTITALLEKEGFTVVRLTHDYKEHNYYSLYENIRFRFSLKFAKNTKGGLAKGKITDTHKKRSFSLLNEIEKLVTHLYSETMCFIEPIVKRGEVITVYANKA